MFACKMHPNDNFTIPITTIDFERASRMRKPFYQTDDSGVIRQFAVCPACANPVQIVGLYSGERAKLRAYGKHYHKPVEGVGIFNPAEYEFCPLCVKGLPRLSNHKLKAEESGNTSFIIDTIKEYFDQIVFYIQQYSGIYISEGLAESMAERYCRSKGFLYVGATRMNIPLVFAHMSFAQNLWGWVIFDDKLKSKLEKSPELYFEGNKIYTHRSVKASLTFCFMNHQRKGINKSTGFPEESIEMLVSLKTDKGIKDIYSKQIKFDFDHWQRLTHTAEENRKNKDRLLAIADKYFRL